MAAGRIDHVFRENGRLALKAFAVFATAVLVTVAFSQLVDTEAAPADDGDEWRFEESTRRLTVAPGASASPQVAWSPDGTLHLAWADARGGSAGVYHKASRNGGWTFTGDRALANGFASTLSPSLAVAPRDGLVGIAWEGRPNATSAPQVYVRASSDDGRTWGRAGTVGAGRFPALAATAGQLLLAYVHPGDPGDQVRLVSLTVVDGSIRSARALFGFNGSALSLALVATGGRAHLAWAQQVQGVTAISHVSVALATGAVAQFILNVFKWLANAFIGLAIGLTTGNWTYFKDNVLEPLRKALEALVKFIIDLVIAAINFIIQPIRDMVNGLRDIAGKFLLGFFNQILSTHGSGTGHSGTHNTNAMAGWVTANQVALMGYFTIAASVIFLAALVAGALLESMPIIGAALTLIFVAVFAITFAVSFLPSPFSSVRPLTYICRKSSHLRHRPPSRPPWWHPPGCRPC